MIKQVLIGLVWLLIVIGLLLILQRRLHYELQAIFVILTRRPSLALGLFSILFLPGVFIHELSHFVMAHLVGVKTGRLSLLPKPINGNRLQLGYVETAQTDIFREALIGTAPLLVGGIFVAFIGIAQLGLLLPVQHIFQGQIQFFLQEIPSILKKPDFWIWFYLVFVISSTMFPSASDRRAWLPIGLIMFFLTGLILFTGIGTRILSNTYPLFLQGLQTVSVVFAISLMVHAVILAPVWFFRVVLSKMTGVKLL
jgi:hypothetical protein